MRLVVGWTDNSTTNVSIADEDAPEFVHQLLLGCQPDGPKITTITFPDHIALAAGSQTHRHDNWRYQ